MNVPIRLCAAFSVRLLMAALSVGPLSALEYDQFGGWLGISGEKTGFFHIQKIDERFWLMTPDGYAFFSLGTTHMREAPEAVKKAFGDEEAYAESAVETMRRVHFNSFGYGVTPEAERLFPFMGILSAPGPRSVTQTAKKYEDIFDPIVLEAASKKIRVYCVPRAQNPNLIGYFYDDMVLWDLSGRDPSGGGWVKFYRELPDGAPGKIKYLDFLKSSPVTNDGAFLRLLARAYYSFMRSEIRKWDTHHLIFGDRYPSSRVEPDILKIASEYVDVLSAQPDAYDGSGAEILAKSLTRDLKVFSDFGLPVSICDHQIRRDRKKFRSLEEVQASDYQIQRGKDYGLVLKALEGLSFLVTYHKCAYVDRSPKFPPGLGLRDDRQGAEFVEMNKAFGEANARFLERLYAKETK